MLKDPFPASMNLNLKSMPLKYVTAKTKFWNPFVTWFPSIHA